MIINGGQAGDIGFWSKHLKRDDTNTRAEVMEIKGLLADDLPSALKEMKAIADQSRSKGNFMYQANLNPEAHERLTPEQWEQAIDILEKKMGFEGHQRIVVEHEKHGRVHRHVIWNRVDVDTLKVADITGNYRKHAEAAREIEQALDLSPTPSPSRDQEHDSAPELWEIRAAERSGIDRGEVRAEITELWRNTDSGKAFAAAVDERGYILAKGDKRDFCIVDHAGDAHSLARRIEDAKAKDVRARMADIDRDSLPTVAEARTQQRERNPTPEAVREAWQNRKHDVAPTQQPEQDKAAQPQPDPAAPELKGTAADIRLAWSLTNSGPEFLEALEARGLNLARVSAEEARASERAHAFAREVGNFASRYRDDELVVVNDHGRVYQITQKITGDDRAEIAKRLGTIDRESLLSVTDAKAAAQDVRRTQFAESKAQERAEKNRQYWQGKPETALEKTINHLVYVHDDNGKLRVALQGEGITIARTDAQGIEDMEREAHERFATTGEILRVPRLREGEIVALSRFGDVYRLNPEKVDIDRLEAAHLWGGHDVQGLSDARAFVLSDHEAGKQADQQHRQERVNERAEARAERQDQAHDDWTKRANDQRARRSESQIDRATVAAKDSIRNAIDDPLGTAKGAAGAALDSGLGAAPAAKAGLKVIDATSGVADFLGNFVDALLGGGPKMPTGAAAQIVAQRRALAAMEHIRDDIEAGRNLRASDIQALTPNHLENIKAKGDGYVMEMVESMDRRRREREREHDRER